MKQRWSNKNTFRGRFHMLCLFSSPGCFTEFSSSMSEIKSLDSRTNGDHLRERRNEAHSKSFNNVSVVSLVLTKLAFDEISVTNKEYVRN